MTLPRVAAIAVMATSLGGCISYYAAKKDDANRRAEEILLGSELAVGAALGTALYLAVDKRDRLPLAANIALATSLVLFLDVIGAGVIAIATCDSSKDELCKK